MLPIAQAIQEVVECLNSFQQRSQGKLQLGTYTQTGSNLFQFLEPKRFALYVDGIGGARRQV